MASLFLVLLRHLRVVIPRIVIVCSMANIGSMKTSILQLLDEQPLRLVASEEPKTAPPVASPSVTISEPNSLLPLLLSTLLFLLTWLAYIQFLG